MPAHRILFTAPGEVSVLPFEAGEPGEGKVLIETLYSAISPGTERAHLVAEFNTVTRSRGFPFQPGYSNIGRVKAAGKGVTALREGQLVATTAPHVSHVVLPAAALRNGEARRRPQPSDLPPEASFTRHPVIWPLEGAAEARLLKACATFNFSKVGLAGARAARIELGEAVLVQGLGPIGLFAAQYARLCGGFPVLGLDPAAERRAVALELKLDGVYAHAAEFSAGHRHMDARGPAVVIEATGRPQAIPQAFQYAARNGRVVILGSTRGATESVDFYTDVHRKGLVVIGVHELTRPVHDGQPGRWTSVADAALVLRLILAGRLACGPLLTHEFPAGRAVDAYRAVRESPRALAVVLDWSGFHQ